MATTRFFVANLPTKTTDKDLDKLFRNYGVVQHVDLKTKENVVDAHDVKTIAFITLKINPIDVQYCIDELNWQQVHGTNIKVSVAKESFLERLKRERVEAESGNPFAVEQNQGNENGHWYADNARENFQNTRKKFSDEVDFEEADLSIDLLITKKSAARSVRNGKIFIENHETEPIHVIERKKTHKQEHDGKTYAADQKRKESLYKMKSQYEQKKLAIQQSLANLDASTNNKIKFDDSEDEANECIEDFSGIKVKTNIFGSDDDDGDEGTTVDLNIKSRLSSKKGAKLVELQSKQSLDPRFRIDAKFIDDDDDEDDDEENAETHSEEKCNSQTEQAENERDWQLGILEQVMGTKINTAPVSQKAAKNKKMLRFDPANIDHQKYLRTRPEDSQILKHEELPQTKRRKRKMSEQSDGNHESTSAPEVSKELYYMVTDTLAESLKSRGDGFSLLNMFGKGEELQERQQQLEKVANERIFINKVDKNIPFNPFPYDCSSESDNEMQTDDISAPQENHKKATKTKAKHHRKQITMEKFFIPKDDERLKEGAGFFRCVEKQSGASEENYEDVRKRLNLLIKTKISKAKKNVNNGVQKRRNKKNRI